VFACPRDQRPLHRRTGPQGVYWFCPTCNGRAVGVELLRRTVAQAAVDQIWNAAREQRVAGGRPCPSCHDLMHEVSSGPSGPAVDVCRVCRFVWFDPTEYDQIAPEVLPAAERATPDRATEILATAQAEAIAKRSERDFGAEAPRELWKYLPALLGLPVEYEQSVFHSVPWLTWAIIAFICAFSIRAFASIEAAVIQFGLIPAQYARYFGLTFLTSFLLHGSFGHLAGNMYFLYVFGDNVEDFLGKARYVGLILIAAVLGDVAHIAMDPRSNVPLIGASGGISGVIAFYALKFPKTKMGVLFRLWLIPIRWFRIPAYAFVGFWILLQFLGVYLELVGASSVSALAHLGGAATGLAFWLMYRHLS